MTKDFVKNFTDKVDKFAKEAKERKIQNQDDYKKQLKKDKIIWKANNEILKKLTNKKYNFIEDLKKAETLFLKKIPGIKIERKIHFFTMGDLLPGSYLRFTFISESFFSDADYDYDTIEILVDGGCVKLWINNAIEVFEDIDDIGNEYECTEVSYPRERAKSFLNKAGEIIIKEKDIKQIHKAYLKGIYMFAEHTARQIYIRK